MSWNVVKRQGRSRKEIDYNSFSKNGYPREQSQRNPVKQRDPRYFEERLTEATNEINGKLSEIREKIMPTLAGNNKSPQCSVSKLTSENDEMPGDAKNQQGLQTTNYEPPKTADLQDLYDAISADLACLETNFLRTIEELRKEFLHVAHQTHELQEKVDNLEQYSRRECLLFHGIPETGKKEQTEDIITDFVKQELNLNLPLGDISRAHRIGRPSPNSKKPRPIVVKFVSYRARHNIFVNKAKLRGKPFLITESLTPYRQQLLLDAQVSIPKKHVWATDGIITILLPDQTKLFIDNRNSLDRALLKWKQMMEKPLEITTDTTASTLTPKV